MQVAKWGNSLAIRLPAKLVAELDLKEGDEIDIRRAPDGAFEIDRKQAVEEWLQKIRSIGPLLPADYRFRREDCYPAIRGGNDESVTDD